MRLKISSGLLGLRDVLPAEQLECAAGLHSETHCSWGGLSSGSASSSQFELRGFVRTCRTAGTSRSFLEAWQILGSLRCRKSSREASKPLRPRNQQSLHASAACLIFGMVTSIKNMLGVQSLSGSAPRPFSTGWVSPLCCKYSFFPGMWR